jgi:hypothetical protein
MPLVLSPDRPAPLNARGLPLVLFRRSHRAHAMAVMAMTPSGTPTPAPMATSLWLVLKLSAVQFDEVVTVVALEEVAVVLEESVVLVEDEFVLVVEVKFARAPFPTTTSASARRKAVPYPQPPVLSMLLQQYSLPVSSVLTSKTIEHADAF